MIIKENGLFYFLIHGDFTPVCTTEFIAFSEANQLFNDRNAYLIGLSIDSNPSHLAWLYDIYQKTGIRVPFPVIADRNGEIARKYGMISSNVSNYETVRNVFIIDDKGKIRTILIYPMEVGRFIPEILRIVEALQLADENNAATPVNWVQGRPLVQKVPKTYEQLEERLNELEQNKNGISWYLTYR